MSSWVSDEAIVLRKFEFGDTSLILHLFTREHGIVPVLAKGAHRDKSPLRGTLDLPSHLSVRYSARTTREIQLLTDAALLESFAGIRKSLDRYYLALYAGELIEEAGQPAGSSELFDLHLRLLRSLDSGRGEIETLWPAFELGFLKAIGLQPALDHCASCGEESSPAKTSGFSPAAGGYLCEKCRREGSRTERIPAAALQVAAKLERTPWDQLARVRVAPEILRQIRRALDGFLHYHWERMPKTRRQMEPLVSAKK